MSSRKKLSILRIPFYEFDYFYYIRLFFSNGLKPTEELPTKYWVFTDKKKTDKCIEYDSMTGTASLQDCNKNNLFVCQLRIKNKQ